MKVRSILLLAFLSLPLTPASAQELVNSAAKPASEPPETNVAERVRLLESELERQNTKLDQLQKTLLEQQQTIQVLIEKLSAKKTSAVVTAEESETPATVAPAARHLAGELAAGPVRDRLATVLGVRALLPLVRVRSRTRMLGAARSCVTR